MKIFILGVGNAFSTDHYSTCFVVQSKDGFNLAVECPHPYLKMLKETPKAPKIEDIDNFIITHLHSDHCNGLETIGFYKKFVENKVLKVRMGFNESENHKDMVSPSMCKMLVGDAIVKASVEDYFDYYPTNGKIGPFTIHSYCTTHHIPSKALLINEGDKMIGFSGDTKFDPKLIEWLSKADFILHEVGEGYGHTSIKKLVELPDNIKRKIRLIHYPDNTITDEFRLAKQGEIIHVE